MTIISPEKLAENIQNYRRSGLSLAEIEKSALAEGISEKDLESALLILRKYHLHEKQTKRNNSIINIVWGVIFSLLVFGISFFVFTQKDKLFSEEKPVEISEETDASGELMDENDSNTLTLSENRENAFKEGRYDMTGLDEVKKVVKKDKTKKILNDFELTIREVDSVSVEEWEVILSSIVNIPTIALNNNEIYVFKFGKEKIWTGFWIHKNKIILAQPLNGKFKNFVEKTEMKHILQNYSSDLVENDLYFIDQFDVFSKISTSKLSKIIKERENLNPIFEKKLDPMKFGYFTRFIKLQRNKKTKAIDGFSMKFQKHDESEIFDIHIYTIEFATSERNVTEEKFRIEMNESQFKQKIKNQIVINSMGTSLWISGDYVIEIDNKFKSFISLFLRKYKSDIN